MMRSLTLLRRGVPACLWSGRHAVLNQILFSIPSHRPRRTIVKAFLASIDFEPQRPP
jgi:hypothetical protein